MANRLCVMHSFDPRGSKVGGLETFVRDMIAFKPDDFTFLMIGVDGIGDLPLGRITRQTYRGKEFDFLPLIHYPEARAREAAQSIKDSINLQFFLGLLKNLPLVRRALKESMCSVDLQRVEFSLITSALGVPFVQMLHGEGAPKLKMDSMLKKYSFVHKLAESYAMRTCDLFLCVNPFITERIRAAYPTHKDKIETLSTWVNTQTFACRPLPPDEGFRVAFAGRLDLFKNPPLMFKTMHRLRQSLPGTKVEFHYIGASDPHRFEEFKLIEDMTVLQGYQDAAGVANILADMQAGILTSEFEGMPFSVLEALSVGRPVVAVDLPQLRSVIADGVSGYLVPRLADVDQQADTLAKAFVQVREAQRSGVITPALVHEQIRDFTPEKHLTKAYENHRRIQAKRFGNRTVARGQGIADAKMQPARE